MLIRRIFCFGFLLLINVLPSTEEILPQTRNYEQDSDHRVRRDVEEGPGQSAPFQGNDCPGCSQSYTPFFSGQCFMCPQGIPGPRGPPGQQGIPGRDGRDGRDASVEGEQPRQQDRPGSPSGDSYRPCNTSSQGAIYVRWGRDICPMNSYLVYSGVAGGGYYSNKGSGSNYLCLPDEPIYDDPVAGSSDQARGYIYAAEYQTSSFSQWSHLHDNNVPCAVCMASSRPSLLMVPARNICPDEGSWVKEYSGYLVSDYYNHDGPSEFVCMDREPQVIPRTSHNADGALFYPVEGRCGTGGSGLPCGPYVDGNELTCAVCTK